MNQNMASKNMWDTAKAGLRRKQSTKFLHEKREKVLN